MHVRKYLQLCSPPESVLLLSDGLVAMSEQCCIASGGLSAPFQTESHGLLEWERLGTIHKLPSFQGFGKLFNKFLWLHPAFLVASFAFGALVILFAP